MIRVDQFQPGTNLMLGPVPEAKSRQLEVQSLEYRAVSNGAECQYKTVNRHAEQLVGKVWAIYYPFRDLQMMQHHDYQ